MKKVILLYFLLTSLSLASFAQQWNLTPAKIPLFPISKSVMDCIYHYEVTDTSLDMKREHYGILEIGDSICKYEGYGNYRVDSAYLAASAKAVVTNRDYMTLSKKYGQSDADGWLIENSNTNRLEYFGRVFIDAFTYKEPIPAIDWQLTDSIKDICGYQCKKATCTFRGLKWTAWYSDIPKSVGPWKLNGLPGLILEAMTENNDHHFTATIIRKADHDIIYEKRDYFKTTRERFNKAYEKYRNNPGQAWNNSPLAPKDMDGKTIKVPRRKLFFNPLEKE